MNRLTKEQFNDRVQAVSRARRIFGPLTEGNITKAFEAYQLILADQDRKVWVTTAIEGNRPPSYLDKYDRPKCPECGSDMLFRVVRDNEEGIKTQLLCSSSSCDVVLNSEMSIDEWEVELRRKDGGRSEQVETGEQAGPGTRE